MFFFVCLFCLLFYSAVQPHCGLHCRLPGLHGHERSVLTSGIYLLFPLSSKQTGSGSVRLNIINARLPIINISAWLLCLIKTNVFAGAAEIAPFLLEKCCNYIYFGLHMFIYFKCTVLCLHFSSLNV